MGVLEEFAPTFVQKPGLKRKDGGLRIECEIQASPLPTVKWSKGDQEVREDEHLRCGIDQTGGSLYVVYVEIKNATQADAGQYSLRASNKLGNVISTVNLDFEAPGKPVPKVEGQPPTFCVKPTVRHDKERNRLVFTCGILADPKPEVTWLRNDVRLTDVGRHGVVLDADGKSRYDATLSVDRVTVEDAGSYKIIARNVLGETTGTITINLDSTAMALPKKGIKPTFTHKPVIQQSEDGDTITFECRLSSDPKSTIAWYHGDKQMRDEVKIEIEEKKQKPSFVEKLVDKNGIVAGLIELTCKVEGHPMPTVTWYSVKWYRDTHELRSDEKFTIETKDGRYILRIKNPEVTDVSQYNIKCNKVTSAARLVVIGKAAF
ncbi:PREDICTED: muscle M-line assembly protein unc-89-like [Priapulus caudatus]|uniref:Muscle M-line assembly protein unc-89-like n=1 Tax=Priapulus caudatus TaxID=37621 RepID=A0ABM1EPN5_PRICU|nr:PREDICTED: muscle M-line assembly protein unc-89-like [Priapulus caudatus]